MNINKILEYHPEKHKLTHILTTCGENILQNLRYDYDGFSNLASRKDEERDMEETFTYDKMNRLTDIYNGSLHSRIIYDPLGRMTDKQADGQAIFSHANFAAMQGQAARPHAMKSAETTEGVFPPARQQVTYTGFDKVKSILEDGNGLIITYGYDQQRIRSYLMTSDNRFLNKDYVGVCEYNTEDLGDEGAIQTTYTYLVGPYGVFAVVENNNNTTSTHYILKDHLGSWTTITDSEGNVEQEMAFDAWGNLRDPETWLNYPTDETTLSLMFDRGFTGHEHMTTFGLINMNGRCYDPLTSSFLSVDAYVQDPTNAQGFNRYAYCSHNPLRYTDPTGWYQQPGASPNPNINLIGTTTYHSDDPCEMLWGRSVHPTQAANPTGFNSTSAGFMVGNGYFGGNIPASHLQAIRAWQNNPCAETSQALENLGITVNVGCILGSLNGVDGFRASNYSWTNADGRAYFAQALDYIGGNEHSYYSMTNKNPDSYDNADIAGKMITTAGLYTYVEGMLHYSETLGIFKDKQGTIRHFIGQPNKNLRKKMKYGKAVSNKFNAAGKTIGVLGTGISVYQAFTETSTDARVEHTIDAIIGVAGAFYPELFGLPATIWFFGGKQLSKWYGEKVITPMIEEGLNPGLMIYQPFK